MGRVTGERLESDWSPLGTCEESGSAVLAFSLLCPCVALEVLKVLKGGPLDSRLDGRRRKEEFVRSWRNGPVAVG
jgi:hypothetical protein